MDDEENLKGIVLDQENRTIRKWGDSYVISPPKRWIDRFPFLNKTLLVIKLVRESNGEKVIVIRKPTREE